MESKERAIRVIAFFTLLTGLVFLLRLWQLQILRGNYYLQLSHKNRVSVVKIPAPRGIIYDRRGKPLVKNEPYFVVSLLPKPPGKEINLSALSELIGLSVEEISERIIRQKPYSLEPITLKRGLRFRDVARIEARRSDFPGLIIQTEIIRSYPYGKTASHLIGYISHPHEEEVRKGKFRDLPKGSYVGRWGAEALFNDRLTGTPGVRFIEVDALGRQLHPIKTVLPVRGEDIRLSIDIEAQKAAEAAFGRRSGALLALNPKNGEVLSLVSLPSFDPNIFVRGISRASWERIINDPGHPFLNRVFQSRYPPGSVFKIVTGLAGLEEGVIGRNFTVFCKGKIEVGIWTFRCWKEEGHGITDFQKAIVESCDIFFYEVGRLLGIDRIAKYAKALGLEMKPGLGLSTEIQGIIPTTSWKKKNRGKPWYLGETFNAAIGQGYVTITPAHAALLISAMANGGSVYRPVLTIQKDPPEPVSKISITPEHLKALRTALVGVVNSEKGTGRRARSERFLIAGKTGTAQVVGNPSGRAATGPRDHAWFVAYAPAEDPSIALSVFVEHGGHGGEAAAPIAKEVIESYLSGEGWE